jgi:hypothetical protein
VLHPMENVKPKKAICNVPSWKLRIVRLSFLPTRVHPDTPVRTPNVCSPPGIVKIANQPNRTINALVWRKWVASKSSIPRVVLPRMPAPNGANIEASVPCLMFARQNKVSSNARTWRRKDVSPFFLRRRLARLSTNALTIGRCSMPPPTTLSRR